jgi:hypothetical protein
MVRRHLVPRFAAMPIDYPAVVAFVADLQSRGLGPTTVRSVRDVFRLVLGLAVKSAALKSNPVTDGEVGRTARRDDLPRAR